jgi:hypothetical protein
LAFFRLMFALRRDLPTVVGHCLHDTTLWDRLSLDLLPEAGRIIISSRRAATTPRRDFPDRRSGRTTAHLPDCDPSSIVRCTLPARKFGATCCGNCSALLSPIAPRHARRCAAEQAGQMVRACRPAPAEQVQLGDVGGDAPGLVAGEQLGRRAWHACLKMIADLANRRQRDG